MSQTPQPKTEALQQVYTRLFMKDVDEIKRRAAARGIPWQIELRLTIRAALKNEPPNLLILKE